MAVALSSHIWTWYKGEFFHKGYAIYSLTAMSRRRVFIVISHTMACQDLEHTHTDFSNVPCSSLSLPYPILLRWMHVILEPRGCSANLLYLNFMYTPEKVSQRNIGGSNRQQRAHRDSDLLVMVTWRTVLVGTWGKMKQASLRRRSRRSRPPHPRHPCKTPGSRHENHCSGSH